MNQETNDKDRRLAALERELAKRTRELKDKDNECQKLKTNHRETLLQGLKTDLAMNDLKKNIKKLRAEAKDNRDFGVEENNRQMQQTIDNLNDLILRLQTENDNLKHILNQKELQYAECKRQFEKIIGQEYDEGNHYIIKEEDGEAEEMPQAEIEGSEVELIILSDDDEDQEERQVLLELPPESVDEFQQSRNSGSGYLSEDENEEEALSIRVPKDKFRKSSKLMRFSDEEDNCLLDFLFNIEPEMKTFVGSSIWERANKALIKVDGNDRHYTSIRHRLKTVLVERLHRRKELTTEKHRRISKLCYEYFFKNIQNNSQKCDQYMAAYDRARQNGFKDIGEISKKKRFKVFSVEEMNQITLYIFNTCKPLPSFGSHYWLTLSSRLKKDGVASRTQASLRKLFSKIILFNLYKKTELNTDEHRKIAVMAFKTYGREFHKKLVEQYDSARLPDTTDEQIARMESFAPKKKAVAEKRPAEKIGKAFSDEEDNKLIELIFKVLVKKPEERKSETYWKKINEQLSQQTNYHRRPFSLSGHFRNTLLPELHNFKELTTPEHRSIAVELYKLWYQPDVSHYYIQLYDARRPTNNNGHSHADMF